MSGLRPSIDEYFAEMTRLAARRSTCVRRSVGCVLVDANHHVLATGYNGVPRGVPHCIDQRCPGASQVSGTGLTLCQAVHAEANALLQCSDVQKIHTAYVTASPCITCMRMLANTGVKRIVFLEEYPHAESRQIAIALGIDWIHHK